MDPRSLPDCNDVINGEEMQYRGFNNATDRLDNPLANQIVCTPSARLSRAAIATASGSPSHSAQSQTVAYHSSSPNHSAPERKSSTSGCGKRTVSFSAETDTSHFSNQRESNYVVWDNVFSAPAVHCSQQPNDRYPSEQNFVSPDMAIVSEYSDVWPAALNEPCSCLSTHQPPVVSLSPVKRTHGMSPSDLSRPDVTSTSESDDIGRLQQFSDAGNENRPASLPQEAFNDIINKNSATLTRAIGSAIRFVTGRTGNGAFCEEISLPALPSSSEASGKRKQNEDRTLAGKVVTESSHLVHERREDTNFEGLGESATTASGRYISSRSCPDISQKSNAEQPDASSSMATFNSMRRGRPAAIVVNVAADDRRLPDFRFASPPQQVYEATVMTGIPSQQLNADFGCTVECRCCYCGCEMEDQRQRQTVLTESGTALVLTPATALSENCTVLSMPLCCQRFPHHPPLRSSYGSLNDRTPDVVDLFGLRRSNDTLGADTCSTPFGALPSSLTSKHRHGASANSKPGKSCTAGSSRCMTSCLGGSKKSWKRSGGKNSSALTSSSKIVTGVCKPIMASRHHKVSDCRRPVQTSAILDRRQPPAQQSSCTTSSLSPQSVVSSSSVTFESYRTIRYLMSVVVGLLVGASTLVYVGWRLQHGLIASLAVSATVAAAVALCCAVSCYFRCFGAVALPSAVGTTGGRLALLLAAGGLIIGGPVANVCRNVRLVSGGLACGLQLGNNRSELISKLGISRPVAEAQTGYSNVDGGQNSADGDVWISHSKQSLDHLQRAVRSAWWRDLRPLDEGLGRLNGALYNGVIQLYGAHKACKTYVERAHAQCVTNIQKARSRCFGVMDALGNVYSHARDVLDRLNPDRWAPKAPAGPVSAATATTSSGSSSSSSSNNNVLILAAQKRSQQLSRELSPQSTTWNDDVLTADDRRLQINAADAAELEELSGRRGDREGTEVVDDRDICDPLHSGIVCQALNASDALCAPTGWAGEEILAALNKTQSALDVLFESIRLRINQQQQQQYRKRRPDDGSLTEDWPQQPPLRQRVSAASGSTVDSSPGSAAYNGNGAYGDSTVVVGQMSSVLDIVEIIISNSSRLLFVLAAILFVGSTHGTIYSCSRLSACGSISNRSSKPNVCRRRCCCLSTAASSPCDLDQYPLTTQSYCRYQPGEERYCVRYRDEDETQQVVLWKSRSTLTNSCRRRCRTTTTTSVASLSIADQMLVVILHAVFAAVCYSFDVSFVWILQLVRRHSVSAEQSSTAANFDSSPAFAYLQALNASADDNLPPLPQSWNGASSGSGDGGISIIAVLDDLMSRVQTDRLFGGGGSSSERRSSQHYLCSVEPHATDMYVLVVAIVIHVFLAISICFRSAIDRWRCRIVGYFYRLHVHTEMGPSARWIRSPMEQSSYERQQLPATMSADVISYSNDEGFVGDVTTGTGTNTSAIAENCQTTTIPTIEHTANELAKPPPTCVVCGQTVSRRQKRKRLSELAADNSYSTSQSLSEWSRGGGSENEVKDGSRLSEPRTVKGNHVTSGNVDDDDDEVCPVCDNRLSPTTISNAATLEAPWRQNKQQSDDVTADDVA